MGRPVGDDIEVQWATEMAVLCRDLGVLPRAGGLLDQDSYHVFLIQNALNAFNKKERHELEAEKSKLKSQSARKR